jgi:hypothetical protein
LPIQDFEVELFAYRDIIEGAKAVLDALRCIQVKQAKRCGKPLA